MLAGFAQSLARADPEIWWLIGFCALFSGFAMALTIGILFGIYSSVLVMAPLVMWMGVSREDLVKPEKRGLEGDKILP